ncbi:hypothetical protein M0812_19614 [Anaeramoeba flamelloides]|uniref:TH1 domain-containing protein n=1 Tax=Anaeramoeba flamelloides TaxID=1746091 RepID=A0AAV7Z2T0_9EUKA|nr:hypothetical protein M0812_19614 [Anaeramoeba flamelloides]
MNQLKNEIENEDPKIRMDNLLAGKKDRRRSSATKEFHGNYLRLENKKNIQNMMKKNRDSRIVFCDTIAKINKRNKVQERVLLITNRNIYNLDPSSYKLLRKIEINKLTAITMSTLPDNFFVLGVRDEYDYLIVSSRKTEILSCIIDCCKRLSHIVEIRFMDNFNYRITEGVRRELRFRLTNEGVSTQLFQRQKQKQKKSNN